MTHPQKIPPLPPFKPSPDVMTAAPAATIRDDLLRGAEEIAEFMFGDRTHRRKIYYLTSDLKKGMPHFKIGSLTCARKSTLLRWIAEQEQSL